MSTDILFSFEFRKGIAMNEQIISRALQDTTINTPCYILDYDKLNKHMDNMLKIADDRVDYCYAMKANPYLIKEINKKISKIEVCSPGELEICRHYQIPGENIVFSGVNKTRQDIQIAFEYGVDVITIESKKQFELVLEYCREHSCNVKLLLRLTSGAQFGMEETEIRSIIANRENYPFIHIIGIHYFSGTQKKKIEKDIEEIVQLEEMLRDFAKDYGYIPEVLEYGLGLSVPYFEGEDFEHIYDNLIQLVDFIESRHVPYRFVFELGRYVVSSVGFYCTTVEDIKQNHDKNYCLIDGGIHQLNYYGQNMAMRTPIIWHIRKNQDEGQEQQEWCICGSLCTFADVLARKATLKSVEIGDVLVFNHAGAYSITEAPYLFLSRRMPDIYRYSNTDGFGMLRQGGHTYQLNSNN